MPSTRGGARHDLAEFDLPSDDDSDPDYCEESSEDESDGPSMRARDRAQWVVDNVEAVEELYCIVLVVALHVSTCQKQRQKQLISQRRLQTPSSISTELTAVI